MMPDKTTRKFIAEHCTENITDLAMKADKYPQVNMKVALEQIGGYQKAKHKIPSWHAKADIIYPPQLSMEQCSSESAARYKASLPDNGEVFIDLTGGFGIDFSFIATKFKKAIYVEIQNNLIQLANHNFGVLGLHQVKTVEDNALNFLQNYDGVVDTIYVDPARRDTSGKKTVLIEDCIPDLKQLDAMLNDKSNTAIIKLSPMLDITQALMTISNVSDIHIVSVDNECKELLFVKSKSANQITALHCVNIKADNNTDKFTFDKQEELDANVAYTTNVGKYLYEPNSSILKAGAFKCVAQRFDLKKLHPNSHLYTSDTLVSDFPGRAFAVSKSISAGKRETKQLLKEIKQSHITVRNFPLSVADLRKQLKIKDGGNYYVFATTLWNEKKTLILCKKLPQQYKTYI